MRERALRPCKGRSGINLTGPDRGLMRRLPNIATSKLTLRVTMLVALSNPPAGILSRTTARLYESRGQRGMGNSARRALLALISRLRTTLEAGFSSSTDEPSPLALHWGLRYLACHSLQLRGRIATEPGASLRHLLSAARESFPAYFHTPSDFTVPAADAVQACEDLIASHLEPDPRIRR